MAKYQIEAEHIEEGTTVFLTGKLGFSRLTRLIDGVDLERSDQRRISLGMIPVKKPHTTLSLTEAQVLYADPQNPTKAEQFIAERFYTSKQNPAAGKTNWSIDSKGHFLPKIMIPVDPAEAASGITHVQDHSKQELASGNQVTVTIDIFLPNGALKRGLGLNSVILHDAPEYYRPKADPQLAARGIVFGGQPRAVDARTEPTGTVEAAPVPEPDTYQEAPGLPTLPPDPGPAAATPQQPAQPQPPAPASQPAVPAQDPAAELARLQAENARLRNGAGAAQQQAPTQPDQSAIGAPTATGPWDAVDPGQQAGITYPGH